MNNRYGWILIRLFLFISFVDCDPSDDGRGQEEVHNWLKRNGRIVGGGFVDGIFYVVFVYDFLIYF